MRKNNVGILGVMGLLVVLGLVYFLAICQDAQAERWNQNASLVPGKYMLVYTWQSETERLLYLQEYQRALEVPSVMNYGVAVIGLTFTVTKEVEGLLEYLNSDPMVMLEDDPVLFREVTNQGITGWVPIELPCAWNAAVEFPA